MGLSWFWRPRDSNPRPFGCKITVPLSWCEARARASRRRLLGSLLLSYLTRDPLTSIEPSFVLPSEAKP